MFLVVGATGDLGSRIVHQLVRERGVSVRCLVRAGADLTTLPDAGVELVEGDLTQPESMAPACQDVDTVVASATVIGRRLAGARRPSIRDVDEIGIAALVDAAERAGVSRFVYVSFARAGRSYGTPLEIAKIRTEERLAASPMRRVVVRPDAFQEIHLGPLGRFDVANGKVTVMGKGDNPRRWVATEDVAALVAAVSVEPDPPPGDRLRWPRAALPQPGDRSRGAGHGTYVQGSAHAPSRGKDRGTHPAPRKRRTCLDLRHRPHAGPHAGDVGRQCADLARHLRALRHRLDRESGRCRPLTHDGSSPSHVAAETHG